LDNREPAFQIMSKIVVTYNKDLFWESALVVMYERNT